MRKAAVVSSFALVVAVTGCGGAQRPNPNCPPAGSQVPFAQLVAQARELQNCEVTTEASYVGAGTGPGYQLFSYPNQSPFRVVPPGQTAGTNAMGMSDANLASLPNSAAGPIFTATTGAHLTLHGRIEFRTQMGVDQGSFSRLFRATSVEIATPPSSGSP